MNAHIETYDSRRLDVSLSDVDVDDLLEYVDENDVINYFSTEKILDQIGIDEVKRYFDLIEKDL